MAWNNPQSMSTRQFRCGYCGYNVANDKGYFSTSQNRKQKYVYICPNCSNATFFDENDRQYPGVAPGNEVDHLPEALDALYREEEERGQVHFLGQKTPKTGSGALPLAHEDWGAPVPLPALAKFEQ